RIIYALKHSRLFSSIPQHFNSHVRCRHRALLDRRMGREKRYCRGSWPGQDCGPGQLCYAVPLAVFGTLHLFGPDFVKDLVPPYMPGRMFWVYFVGCALIAAALSIATKIAVPWSGLLVGIMMLLFVGMLYLPSGLRHLHTLASILTANTLYPQDSNG